jgi:hypothetical protein
MIVLRNTSSFKVYTKITRNVAKIIKYQIRLSYNLMHGITNCIIVIVLLLLELQIVLKVLEGKSKFYGHVFEY